MGGNMPGNRAASIDLPEPGGPTIHMLCTINKNYDIRPISSQFKLVNHKMTRKAYAYSRLSTEKQLSGHGLERQRKAVQKYATENNLELIEEYEDIGLSGFTGANSKVGKFGEFVRGIEDGLIDSNCTLIVENLDRISREQPLTAQANFIRLINSGVEIVTLLDHQKYNKQIINKNPHLLYISLGTMIRAHDESLIKSTRLKSAWRKKRELVQSKPLTKIAPAWLILEDGKFIEKHNSFTVIRKIFDLCISHGCGALAITKFLNQNCEEFPPFSKSGKWTKSYITKILKNPSVFGNFQPHQKINGSRVPVGTEIQGYFPAIISKETFSLAQKEISNRANGGGGRHADKFRNIFFKLLKCGSCKGGIGYFNKGGNEQYLRCLNSHHNHLCQALNFRYDEFESHFLKYVDELDWASVIINEDIDQQHNKIKSDLAFAEQELVEGVDSLEITKRKITKLDDELFEDFSNLIKEKKNFIFDKKKQCEALKNQLSQFERFISKTNKTDFTKLVDRISSDEQSRRKINTYLRSIIEVVRVHYQPVAIGGIFDKRLRKEVKKLDPSDPKNSTKISKLNFHFFVKFKSGVVTETYPNLQSKVTWVTQSHVDLVSTFKGLK